MGFVVKLLLPSWREGWDNRPILGEICITLEGVKLNLSNDYSNSDSQEQICTEQTAPNWLAFSKQLNERGKNTLEHLPRSWLFSPSVKADSALLPSSRNNKIQTFPAKVQLELIIFIINPRHWYYCVFLRKCVRKQGVLFPANISSSPFHLWTLGHQDNTIRRKWHGYL